LQVPAAFEAAGWSAELLSLFGGELRPLAGSASDSLALLGGKLAASLLCAAHRSTPSRSPRLPAARLAA
jgi:hypothetical protein